MGRKVAELNTLSDGKGITGIRFFNEMCSMIALFKALIWLYNKYYR